MFRTAVILTAFVLAVSACSSPDEVPVVGATSATTTTRAVTTTTKAATTTTTTTTPASPLENLRFMGVMLSFDGATRLGTLEAVLCNEGTEPVDGVSVELGTAAATVDAGLVDALEPQTCAAYRDDAVDLDAFGIDAPGPWDAAVTLRQGSESASFDETVEVPFVTFELPAEQASNYERCLGSDTEDGCADYVTYFPVPGELMKRRGTIQSIAPREVEILATLSVIEQEICRPPVENFLRTEGPRPTSHRYVVQEYIGAYAGAFVSWTTSGPLQHHQGSVDYIDFWWHQALDGLCAPTVAHELTHLTLGDVPSGAWFEEGLADWMHSGPGVPSDSEKLQCREDAYYGYSQEVDGDTWVPFKDLDAEYSEPRYAYYASTTCFWRYLEETYGTGTIQEIISLMVSYRDPEFNYCSPLTDEVFFIRDTVVPVVGSEILPVIQERWGVGETYNGCEGV